MEQDGARRGAGELTDEVLDALRATSEWQTVRDVHAQLERRRPIAYTTVLTVLQRLERSGVVDHERVGRAGRYRIAVDADRRGARNLVDQAVARFGPVAIAQFVERSRQDPELLAELRRLVDAEDSDA